MVLGKIFSKGKKASTQKQQGKQNLEHQGKTLSQTSGQRSSSSKKRKTLDATILPSLRPQKSQNSMVTLVSKIEADSCSHAAASAAESTTGVSQTQGKLTSHQKSMVTTSSTSSTTPMKEVHQNLMQRYNVARRLQKRGKYTEASNQMEQCIKMAEEAKMEDIMVDAMIEQMLGKFQETLKRTSPPPVLPITSANPKIDQALKEYQAQRAPLSEQEAKVQQIERHMIIVRNYVKDRQLLGKGSKSKIQAWYKKVTHDIEQGDMNRALEKIEKTVQEVEKKRQKRLERRKNRRTRRSLNNNLPSAGDNHADSATMLRSVSSHLDAGVISQLAGSSSTIDEIEVDDLTQEAQKLKRRLSQPQSASSPSGHATFALDVQPLSEKYHSLPTSHSARALPNTVLSPEAQTKRSFSSSHLQGVAGVLSGESQSEKILVIPEKLQKSTSLTDVIGAKPSHENLRVDSQQQRSYIQRPPVQNPTRVDSPSAHLLKQATPSSIVAASKAQESNSATPALNNISTGVIASPQKWSTDQSTNSASSPSQVIPPDASQVQGALNSKDTNKLQDYVASFLECGDMSQAVDIQKQSLRLHKESGDTKEQLSSMMDLGDMLLMNQFTSSPNAPQITAQEQKKESQKALRMFKQSLNLVKRKMGESTPEEAQLHNRMGEVMESSGDIMGSIKCFQKALRIHSDSNDDESMAINLLDLGRAYSKSGSHQMALDCFAQAESMLTFATHSELCIQAVLCEAHALKMGGYLAQGRQVLEKKLLGELLRNTKEIPLAFRGEIFNLLGSICLEQNQVEQAQEYFRQSCVM